MRKKASICMRALVCALVIWTATGGVIAQEAVSPPSETPQPEKVTVKESDAPEKPKILFGNEKDVQRLLGENPSFVYDPTNRRDPMIVPWIRDEVIATELIEEAKNLSNKGRYKEARTKLLQVISQYARTKQITSARILLSQVDKLSKQPTRGPGHSNIQFPSWISSNTKGVMWDAKGEDHWALVGDFTLKKGDKVPNFDEVTIEEIRKNMVIFTYKKKQFEVMIEVR